MACARLTSSFGVEEPGRGILSRVGDGKGTMLCVRVVMGRGIGTEPAFCALDPTLGDADGSGCDGGGDVDDSKSN